MKKFVSVPMATDWCRGCFKIHRMLNSCKYWKELGMVIGNLKAQKDSFICKLNPSYRFPLYDVYSATCIPWFLAVVYLAEVHRVVTWNAGVNVNVIHGAVLCLHVTIASARFYGAAPCTHIIWIQCYTMHDSVILHHTDLCWESPCHTNQRMVGEY